MKLEYHGRWLSFSLELFPQRKPRQHLRYEPPGKAPVLRRRLLRRIEAQLRPPATAT